MLERMEVNKQRGKWKPESEQNLDFIIGIERGSSDYWTDNSLSQDNVLICGEHLTTVEAIIIICVTFPSMEVMRWCWILVCDTATAIKDTLINGVIGKFQ